MLTDLKTNSFGVYVLSSDTFIKNISSAKWYTYDSTTLDKQNFSEIAQQSHIVFTNISPQFYEMNEIIDLVTHTAENNQVIVLIEPVFDQIPHGWYTNLHTVVVVDAYNKMD